MTRYGKRFKALSDLFDEVQTMEEMRVLAEDMNHALVELVSGTAGRLAAENAKKLLKEAMNGNQRQD